MKKIFAIIGILILISIGIVVFHPIANSGQNAPSVQPTNSISRTQTTVTYKGETGKDALTLLKATTSVDQDKSGLVNEIGGRKADNAKHEYWAFYVNGKLAAVGPAQYVTKNGDTIVWKIEKY